MCSLSRLLSLPLLDAHQAIGGQIHTQDTSTRPWSMATGRKMAIRGVEFVSFISTPPDSPSHLSHSRPTRTIGATIRSILRPARSTSVLSQGIHFPSSRKLQELFECRIKDTSQSLEFVSITKGQDFLPSISPDLIPVRIRHSMPNKTDAGNGSNGICRVIDASRSPSPDPSRSPNQQRHS